MDGSQGRERNSFPGKTIRERLMRRLNGDPARLGFGSLRSSLTFADVDELAGLIQLVFRSHDRSAMAAALLRLHELPLEDRRILCASAPLMVADAARSALTVLAEDKANAGDAATERVRGLLSTIAHLLERADAARVASLADVALDLLADPPDRIERALTGPMRRDLARAFRLAVSRVLAPGGGVARRLVTDSEQEAIDRVLARAAATAREHRAADILFAIALAAPRPGPALAAEIARDDSTVAGELRGVAERIDESDVRTRLLRWLGTGVLGRPAARWMHRVAGVAARSEMLEQGHLLLAPRRHPLVRAAQRPTHMIPGDEELAALTGGAQRWLPHLIAHLDLGPATRPGRLSALAGISDDVARWRAAVMIGCISGPRGRDAIVPFARDACPIVAHEAGRSLLAHGGAEASESRTLLERSSHPRIRRSVRRRAAVERPNELPARWEGLDHTGRRVAFVSFCQRDPAAAAQFIEDRLVRPDRDTRLEALGFARRFRLVAALEPVIVRLLADPATDARVAATAAAALDASATGDAIEALVAALDHAHDRVRANALEALARRAPRRAATMFASAARESTNRERANAIGGLLGIERETGVAHLRAMLADGDPLHRVSAIWLARSRRVTEVVPTLNEMAGQERAPVVQVRAAWARRLLVMDGPRRTTAERARPTVTGARVIKRAAAEKLEWT